MPEERFTYSVTYPGVRAPGLTVGKFAVAFDVMDYTGTAEDRTAGLRELAAEAIAVACRRLAARYPDLLLADVTIPRLELAIDLQLPTWFQGSPPAAVAERVAEPLVQAVPGAAGEALAAASAAVVDDLAPDLQLELGPVYQAAKAAVEQGAVAAGARLYRAAEQRRTWHEAALHVAADLPAAAGAISAPSRRPEPGGVGAVGAASQPVPLGPGPRPEPTPEPRTGGPGLPAAATAPGRPPTPQAAPNASAAASPEPESWASPLLSEVTAEVAALQAAAGSAAVRAALLGAVVGPLLGAVAGPLLIAALAESPGDAAGAGAPSTRELNAATAAVAAYLGGSPAARLLKQKGGRGRWPRKSSGK